MDLQEVKIEPGRNIFSIKAVNLHKRGAMGHGKLPEAKIMRLMEFRIVKSKN